MSAECFAIPGYQQCCPWANFLVEGTYTKETLPPILPLDVFTLGSYFSLIFLSMQTLNLFLLPFLGFKTYENYKEYKVKQDKKLFAISVLYFSMNVLAIVAALADSIAFTIIVRACYDGDIAKNCHVPDAEERFAYLVYQFAISSITLLYITRFYAFIEGMATMKPTKLELNIYFWYSIFSFSIYLLFFFLDYYDVVVQEGYPLTHFVVLFENIVIEGLFFLMIYRLRDDQVTQVEHPMIRLCKDTTYLLAFYNGLRVIVQIIHTVISFGKIEDSVKALSSSLPGSLEVIFDALLIFIMNIIVIRAVDYCNAGAKAAATNATSFETSKTHRKSNGSGRGLFRSSSGNMSLARSSSGNINLSQTNLARSLSGTTIAGPSTANPLAPSSV